MRVVFAGTPEVAVPSLDAIAATRPRPGRRGHPARRPRGPWAAGWSPARSRQRAEELGVPVLKPDHPRDPEFQAALRELAPDCCPVVAYGALLPQSALDIPPHGWVNLHFSVLPAWRGAAPVQHALWAGDEVTGATTFRIVKAMDAGPTFGVMTETDPADRHRRRPARPAGRGRRRAARRHPRRHRGRHARGARAARRRASASPPRSPSTTPGSTGPSRRRGRPPGPGLHPGARRLVDPRRGADQARPGRARARPPRPAAGRARGHQAGRPRRDRRRVPVRLGQVKAFGKKEMPAADWARGVRLESGSRFA